MQYTMHHSGNYLADDRFQSNGTETFCLAQYLASIRSWEQNECWSLELDEQCSPVHVSFGWSLLPE
jgi:hypothetical protein